MPEKNIELDKLLNKNYGGVIREEIKTKDKLKSISKEFQTSTNNLDKTLKKEIKQHTALDKDIKARFAANLKEIKANYNNHLKDIESRVKGIEKDYQDHLIDATKKFEDEINRLNDLVEEIKSENEKLILEVNNKYNSDIKDSEKEKTSIIKIAEKNLSSLLSALKDAQDKYEVKVVDLNEKRDRKVEKLNAAFAKKVEKLNSEVEKEQIKTAKSIGDLKEPFAEKLAVIEEKISVEKNKFTTKDSGIKSTLESKVARHEKFMNKSLRDNDTRAVKQHKKEIAVLEKKADRELKLLSREHGDRYGVLNAKKAELITKNLNKIAAYETNLINFEEERFHQIELCKATLENDIEVNSLNTRQTLEDELNKYNEYFASNEREQSELKKTEELDLENQEDIQVNLKNLLDKTNNINAVKLQEALAIKDKEFKLNEINKNLADVLARLSRDIELTKLTSEKDISLKELIQSQLINQKKEAIEYYNNDYNKQASVNNEYLYYQIEFTKQFKDRAESISGYENVELNNRIKLKVSFLEERLSQLAKDYELIVSKINEIYETEKTVFEAEIDLLVKDALADLAQFKVDSTEEIDTLVKKRNAFDPRAYKKEIKVLDKEISNKENTFNREYKSRNEAINEKTGVFNKAVGEALIRKEDALKEMDLLNSSEQSNLNSAIELLKKELNDETINISERLDSTLADSSNYDSLALDRNRLVIEQNSSYKDSRINTEEERIRDIKSNFESEKHNLTNQMEEALVNLLEQKDENSSQAKHKILNEEKFLEEKINGFDSKISKYNEEANSLDDSQRDSLQVNNSRIEQKNSNRLVSISKELNGKIDKYKDNTMTIDRENNDESRKFENAKKEAQRNYDAALSKRLGTINQKLQNDLKNI